MTSSAETPGDVILIDSSDEDTPSFEQKRARSKSETDADASSSNGSLRKSKKPRLSQATSSSSKSPGSEEGEIEESEKDATAAGRALKNSPVSRQDKQDDKSAISTGDNSSCVVMPDARIEWSKNSKTFCLPVFTAKKEGSWPERLKDWVQAFYRHNPEQSRFITPVLATEAFVYYLDSHSGLKSGKRKNAKQAANQLQKSGVTAKLLQALRGSDEVTAKAARAKGSVSNGASSSNDAPRITNGAPHPTRTEEPQKKQQSNMLKEAASHIECEAPAEDQRETTGDKQLAQQRKYFPSAADASKVCLSCAREGHVAANCPHSSCRFCGSQEHWDFCCPTKERCTNCRQSGHSAATCVEKLKLTRGDGLACVFCNSADHLEDECTDFWRSFHPDADTIKTVTSLPVSCAICGAKDHFLSDCNQRVYPANPTWSLANHDRYIDACCERTPIESLSYLTGDVPRGPKRKMLGPSSKTANVHYSESEDSDMDFLSNRIPKRPARGGQMRMSNNIPNRNAGRPPPPPAFQPPLPPGPPPGSSHISRSRFRSQPQSTVDSLPAKPPPPSSGYHNVPPPPMDVRNGHSRGISGNRGGRGGRTRGRGRGRGRGK